MKRFDADIGEQVVIAWVFPGQGSQFVGMGAGLAAAPAREVFEAARDVLGWDVRALCLDGPEELLGDTERTQPAVFTVSLAAARSLAAQGLAPDAVAGHSVGELSAIAAVDALSLEDALRLVAVRSRGMAEAARANPGGMLAILGLPLERIEKICAASAAVMAVANINGAGQVVVSGAEAGLPDLASHARAAGAKRVVRLAVGAACHSPLMEPARAQLERAIGEVHWAPARAPLASGVTGRLHSDPAELADLVVRGVTAPVRWEDAVRALTAEGADYFVEVGAGSILSGLIRRIAPAASTTRAGDDAEIQELAASMTPAHGRAGGRGDD